MVSVSIRVSSNLIFSFLKIITSAYIEAYMPLSELMKKYTVKALLALLAIKNLFKHPPFGSSPIFLCRESIF